MVEILNRDWPNIAQMVKDAAEQGNINMYIWQITYLY